MKTDALFEMVLLLFVANSELLATKSSKNGQKCAVNTPIVPQVRRMENGGLSLKLIQIIHF